MSNKLIIVFIALAFISQTSCASVTGFFNVSSCEKVNSQSLSCWQSYGFTVNIDSFENTQFMVGPYSVSISGVEDYLHYTLEYVRTCYGGTPIITAVHTHLKKCLSPGDWKNDFCGVRCHNNIYGITDTGFPFYKTYMCCLSPGALNDYYEAAIYKIISSHIEYLLEFEIDGHAYIFDSDNVNSTWYAEDYDFNFTRGITSMINPSQVMTGYLVEIYNNEGKRVRLINIPSYQESIDGLCAIPSNGTAPDWDVFYRYRNVYYLKAKHNGRFHGQFVGLANINDFDDLSHKNKTKDYIPVTLNNTRDSNGTLLTSTAQSIVPCNVAFSTCNLDSVSYSIDENAYSRKGSVNSVVTRVGASCVGGSEAGYIIVTSGSRLMGDYPETWQHMHCLVQKTSIEVNEYWYEWTKLSTEMAKYQSPYVYCFDWFYRKNLVVVFNAEWYYEDGYYGTLHSGLTEAFSYYELSNAMWDVCPLKKQLIISMNHTWDVAIIQQRCIGPIQSQLLNRTVNSYKFCFSGCDNTWIINEMGEGCQLNFSCCITYDLHNGRMCLKDMYGDNCVTVEIYGYTNRTHWWSDVVDYNQQHHYGVSTMTIIIIITIVLLMVCCCKSKGCSCNCRSSKVEKASDDKKRDEPQEEVIVKVNRSTNKNIKKRGKK